MPNNTCRVCFGTNIRMYSIRNTSYSLVHELNTGCKLITGNGPDTICLYCTMLLLKFKRFLDMSRKAEKYHSEKETVIDLTDDNSEFITNLDKDFHNLSTTSSQCITLNSETDFKEDVFDMKPVWKQRNDVFIEDVAVKIERVDCNDFDMFQEMPIPCEMQSDDDDDDDQNGLRFYYESDHDHTYASVKKVECQNVDVEKKNVSIDLFNGENDNITQVSVQNVTTNPAYNAIVTPHLNGETANPVKGENVTVNKEDVTVNKENVTVNKENVTVNKENVTVNKENVIVNKENVATANTVFSMSTRRRRYSEANPVNKVQAVNGKNETNRSVNAKNEYVNALALPEVKVVIESIPTKPIEGITPNKPKKRGHSRPKKDEKSIHHSHRTRSNTKKQQYSCHDCDFECQLKKKLYAHVKSTHEIRMYSCKVCLQRFPDVNLLSKHVKAKHRTLECPLCGKELTTAFSYRRHMRLHSQTELYHCETCRRAFKHRSMYLVHARTHTGEKPFRCKWCDRAFNDKSNCRKHMLSHEGRRARYSCALCLKNFWQKSQLKSHAIEHIV